MIKYMYSSKCNFDASKEQQLRKLNYVLRSEIKNTSNNKQDNYELSCGLFNFV